MNFKWRLDMKTRIVVAAIAVPILFVIMFFLKPVFLAVLTALLCAIASFEFLGAVMPACSTRMRIYSAVCALAVPLAELSESSGMLIRGIAALYLIVLFIEAICSYRKEEPIGFECIAYCIFSGLLYPGMLSSLVTLKCLPEGRLYVLLPIVVTFCCDSGAYFVGMFIGKRKIMPHVSPNKSLEGFIGGIVAGVLCMMIYGGIVQLASKTVDVNMLSIVLCGIFGSIAVEVGDLAFSVIKRQHNIKDYGKLIPGHGGVLDRFDSMAFSAPLICGIIMLLPAFNIL